MTEGYSHALRYPGRARTAAGLLACLLTGADALLAQTPVARVSGFAFDSITMRPLPGALIQLVAATDPTRVRSATSDERGAYAIDSVQVGTYLLGFFHPRLDSLGIEAPLQQVDIRTPGEIRAQVAIPSGRTLVARLCGPTIARDSLGLFMGVVRSARGEALPAPARIRAQWTEVRLGPAGLERRSPTNIVTTSPTGSFAICGIPVEGTFRTRAFVGGDSSGFVELEAPRGGLLYRDIYVGAATKAPESGGAPRLSAPVLRGNGALRGVVRSATGQPVRDARLVMWGNGREDTTSASGQFAMQSIPSGTYTLESRAIGYLPKRIVVDVPDGSEGVAALVMEAFVPTVDTMRIRANANPRINQLADFERRKRAGGGYFLDETQLARRNPMYNSDIFRMAPGTSIIPADMVGDRIMMRGAAGGGSCVPAVFLNGMPVVNVDGNLDNIVNPQQVRAVEIYSRTASVPIQFQSQNGCGSIVIWTGARRP
ncbi:MAG: carboxypeptidase regulatory-like domain-containing protein [Gemmatimonadaceae bacterium]|nr:carboxypeptidase regulatory-like domain-containing protein [Gemmatimonadaceae bacterium]